MCKHADAFLRWYTIYKACLADHFHVSSSKNSLQGKPSLYLLLLLVSLFALRAVIISHAIRRVNIYCRLGKEEKEITDKDNGKSNYRVKYR